MSWQPGETFRALGSGLAVAAICMTLSVPAATAAPFDQPDSWLASASVQPDFVRTPMNELGCLMTDTSGGNLIEGSLGGPPQPCPTSGKGAIPLPITNGLESFVVASRQITSLMAGSTLDATANIEVSTPDFETNRPDGVSGRLILASSPTSTSGAPITTASGGFYDWPNLQHHMTLNARGSYTASSTFSTPVYVNFVLTDYTADPCSPTAGETCYAPCDENGATVANPPYDQICVNAGYSLVAVQIFQPATPGQPLMAVDPMVSTPVVPTTLTYGQASQVWVSPPITNLAPGQVITAHADLGFTWDGKAGGGPLPACEPNIWTQVELVNQQTGTVLAMTQEDPTTNLTPTELSNTLSPFGSVAIAPNGVPSGTWNVVIYAGADVDSGQGCLDDPTSVGTSGGASDAAAFRFRAASSGEAGWQERAASSSSPDASTESGPQTTLYTSPPLPEGLSPSEVLDVAGAAELGADNCGTSVLTGLDSNGGEVNQDSAGIVPANATGYPSPRLPLTHGGAELVPYTGAEYSGTVTLTAQSQPDDASCLPTGPLAVEKPGGGVYVESYWPTETLDTSGYGGGRWLLAALVRK